MSGTGVIAAPDGGREDEKICSQKVHIFLCHILALKTVLIVDRAFEKPDRAIRLFLMDGKHGYFRRAALGISGDLPVAKENNTWIERLGC